MADSVSGTRAPYTDPDSPASATWQNTTTPPPPFYSRSAPNPIDCASRYGVARAHAHTLTNARARTQMPAYTHRYTRTHKRAQSMCMRHNNTRESDGRPASSITVWSADARARGRATARLYTARDSQRRVAVKLIVLPPQSSVVSVRVVSASRQKPTENFVSPCVRLSATVFSTNVG